MKFAANAMSESPHAFGSGIASLVERQANDPRAIRIGPPYAQTAGQQEAPPMTPQKLAASPARKARSSFGAASPLASSSEIGAAVGAAPRAAVPAAGVPASSARVAGDFDTSGQTWWPRGGESWKRPQHAYDHDGANGSLSHSGLLITPREAPPQPWAAGSESSATAQATAYEGSPVKARSIRTEAWENPATTAIGVAGVRSDDAKKPGQLWWMG